VITSRPMVDLDGEVRIQILDGDEVIATVRDEAELKQFARAAALQAWRNLGIVNRHQRRAVQRLARLASNRKARTERIKAGRARAKAAAA
jgi:hypothetical protein